jgi:hypothetical protein
MSDEVTAIRMMTVSLIEQKESERANTHLQCVDTVLPFVNDFSLCFLMIVISEDVLNVISGVSVG